MEENSDDHSIAIKWEGLKGFYASVGLEAQYTSCSAGIFPKEFSSSSSGELETKFINCDYSDLNDAFDLLEVCIHRELLAVRTISYVHAYVETDVS